MSVAKVIEISSSSRKGIEDAVTDGLKRASKSIKNIKAAIERGDPSSVVSISQSVAVDRGIVYYIAQLSNSLAWFDGRPSLVSMMGAENYAAYQKEVSEIVTTAETLIYRIVPEFSNPPEDQVAAAPDFWRPKPRPAAAKPAAPKDAAKK